MGKYKEHDTGYIVDAFQITEETFKDIFDGNEHVPRWFTDRVRATSKGSLRYGVIVYPRKKKIQQQGMFGHKWGKIGDWVVQRIQFQEFAFVSDRDFGNQYMFIPRLN